MMPFFNNKVKKSRIYEIGVFIFVMVALLFIICSYRYFRIKNAKIEITLVDNLTAEFLEEKKVSDFISSINGKIIDDYQISTTEIGEKDVSFSFINDDNIRLKYKFQIEVLDTVAPLVWISSSYSLPVGSEMNLTEKILCGDNYDNTPNCYIEGEYDVEKEGIYPLTFVAVDKSGNQTEKNFTLKIYEPQPSNNKPTTPSKKTYTSFQSVVDTYKTPTNRIGLDVSHHQGTIDFEKIENAGVEFMMIRLGGTRGTNGEYFIDKQFEENMKKAKEYDIPVGVYFYSYANSIESAEKDAEFVIKELKKYKLDLPVAFDWEEWKNFNSYHLSFFGLTSMAEAFLEKIEKAGYQGMLYSSRNYLEQIWFPTKYKTWLAHYTKNTSYEGEYFMWQLCENGQIDGIEGAVDIDILYP